MTHPRKSPLPQPKIAYRGATDNPFGLGDQMKYVGFFTFNGTEIVSGHVLQVLDASQTVVLTFEDGLPCSGTPTVTDHEGNVYATVKIGQQCWMRENLRTTTSLSTGTYLVPAVNTGYTYTGKQARWYNNDSATYAPMNYGLLYNWNAAMDTFNTAYGETSVNTDDNNAVSMSFMGSRRGICPAGNIGCGNLITRKCLLQMVNLLRTGVRQGLKRKWTAVCGFRNPLSPLKRGKPMIAVAGACRTLQRKARRRGGGIRTNGHCGDVSGNVSTG